jgi:RimJ/RimL family protein N-acetyltransferase
MPKVENPILLDAPDHFETERLLVRVSRAGDGQIVYAAIQESLPELKPWLHWAHEERSLDTVETLLRRAVAQFILRERFLFFAFAKSDRQFVAQVSLHSIDWSVPAMEIGYWVRTSMGGQGFMTEAVRGLTDYAFTHLLAERMVIKCDTRNERSAAVARRLGYMLEGSLRSDMREVDDSLSSGFVFSLLRAEWAQSLFCIMRSDQPTG